MGRHRKTRKPHDDRRTVLDTIRAATQAPPPAPTPTADTPPPTSPPPRTDTPPPRSVETTSPFPRPDLRVVDGEGRPSTVTVETADDVAVLYPDGSRVPVGWELNAVTDGGRHRRYIADVPQSARLASGMVIQAGAWVMPVKLNPTTSDWYLGGAQ